MRALLLLLLCSAPWLASAPPVHAECECVWQGSFTEAEAATDLVISGTVIASKGNSIDLSVSQVLRGPEPPEPLRIWLHTADYCRPDVALFPVGTQWVLQARMLELHGITVTQQSGAVEGSNRPAVSQLLAVQSGVLTIDGCVIQSPAVEDNFVVN